jgi:competence protein CoiA
MQICALDIKGNLIFADGAHKHQDYLCIECQQIVRLRRGIHRTAHYYHLQPNRKCRQDGKGMPHLQLQYYLKNHLPESEVELECRFPKIGRIADVAWHPQKIIYEIQCSPISSEEINARNADYASVGYQVIWIFHDSRYNKQRLSAAEISALRHPHYFTNMNAKGEGIIYDQCSLVVNHQRTHRLPMLSVDILSPISLTERKRQKKIPIILQQRANSWPIGFRGDTLDRFFDESPENISFFKPLFAELNQELKSNFKTLLITTWHSLIRKPYQAVMNLILEKACR